MTINPSEIAAHKTLPEPKLLFSNNQLDTHPLRGLVNFGPYSLDLSFPRAVRLACLAPEEYMNKLEALINELQNPASVKDAPNYYLSYPGFKETFRVPISLDDRLKLHTPDECREIASA